MESNKEHNPELEQKRFGAALFLLGIVYGIIGNLVANVFDRQFAHFGMIYNTIVVVIFGVCVWYAEKEFTKAFGK